MLEVLVTQITGSFIQEYTNGAGPDGEHLAVQNTYRNTYIDTVGGGLLQDWTYRPLDEIGLADNSSAIDDYRINLSADYKLLKGLTIDLLYQYSKGSRVDEEYYQKKTYFARNLYNQYAKVSYSGGVPSITPVLPASGILDLFSSQYFSQQGRAQLNYSLDTRNHEFTSIAGVDIKDLQTQIRSNRLYGYDEDLQTAVSLNYMTRFPLNPSGTRAIISNLANRRQTQRFISTFLNLAYSFDHRYDISVSVRKDASNLFGVNTNQRAVPLGSVGISWNPTNEEFFNASWLENLKVRATIGYNGNLDNNASALATIQYAVINNAFGAAYAAPSNAPNPSLRWERVLNTNFGVDFAVGKHRISGSADVYRKVAKDVLGSTPIAPQTGYSSVYRNAVDIVTQGMDVVLHSKNMDGKFKWVTDFLASYARDKVVRYNTTAPDVFGYLTNAFINAVEGRPVYGLYSFSSVGLDAEGQPQGVLNGKITTSYSDFFLETGQDNLRYHGPVTPVHFGSIRNTFTWRGFEASVNVTYKAGYFFRRTSINYSEFLFSRYAHPDYNKRWMSPGDETKTTVPAAIYPVNFDREIFYQNSDKLVERGDHIRLQDVQASYRFRGVWLKRMAIESLRIYTYINNAGIIWRANKQRIDPDFVPANGQFIYPTSRMYTLGLQCQL